MILEAQSFVSLFLDCSVPDLNSVTSKTSEDPIISDERILFSCQKFTKPRMLVVISCVSIELSMYVYIDS